MTKTKAGLALKNLKATTNLFLGQLIQATRSINDNYDEDITTIKEDLLVKIANDYSLDINELKSRYLKKKKSKTNKKTNEEINDFIDADDDQDNKSEYEYSNNTKSLAHVEEQILLFKTTYENNDYYIELIEGGNVYDIKNNVVGVWRDNQMELYLDIIKQLNIVNVQINETKEIDDVNTVQKPVLDDDFNNTVAKPKKSATRTEPLGVKTRGAKSKKTSDVAPLKKEMLTSGVIDI